jgi:hypothetical protein
MSVLFVLYTSEFLLPLKWVRMSKWMFSFRCLQPTQLITCLTTQFNVLWLRVWTTLPAWPRVPSCHILQGTVIFIYSKHLLHVFHPEWIVYMKKYKNSNFIIVFSLSFLACNVFSFVQAQGLNCMVYGNSTDVKEASFFVFFTIFLL